MKIVCECCKIGLAEVRNLETASATYYSIHLQKILWRSIWGRHSGGYTDSLRNNTGQKWKIFKLFATNKRFYKP